MTELRVPKQGPIDGLYGPVSVVRRIEFFLKAFTNVGSGRGVVKLAEVDGYWKVFTPFTTLQEFRGILTRDGPLESPTENTLAG